jgi:hypothetical protein
MLTFDILIIQIDQTGRFYHPYLGYWDPQKNTLVETLQLMRSIFAQQPPVYSKPISTATTAVSASPGSSSSTPASPPTAAYSSLGRASTTGAIRPAPGFLPMPQTTFLVVRSLILLQIDADLHNL